MATRLQEIHRSLLRMLGGDPREDNEQLRETLKRKESQLKHVSRQTLSTGSRTQLYIILEIEFKKLQQEKDERANRDKHRERIAPIIDEYYALPETLPDIYSSVGSEGGTYLVRDFRMKRLTQAKAKLSAEIVDHLCAQGEQSRALRDHMVYTDYAGNYLISENFIGKPVWGFARREERKAPEHIWRAHYQFAQDLEGVDFTAVLFGIEREREQYQAKLLQNLALLKFHGVLSASEETMRALYGAAAQNESHAVKPFLDMNPINAKWNEQGELKEFDFEKINTLVIPLYDIAQIAYQHGREESHEYREEARRNWRMNPLASSFDFDDCWERSASTFLLRRLYYAVKDGQEGLVGKYQDALLQEKFKVHEAATLLARDLKRSSE